MRLERDTARTLLVQVASKLQEALDEQRKGGVALARDLAAARADNERLTAERRIPQIDSPPKPRFRYEIAGITAERADNERPTAERRIQQIESPPKRRSRHEIASIREVKPASQRTARSEVSNPSRVSPRRITLPYSLLPTFADALPK